MKMSTRFVALARSRTKELLMAVTLLLGANVASAQAPVNDDTSGAISLNFNADLNIANAIAGTMVGATASASVNAAIPTTGCSPSGMTHDVWYKFTPTTAKAGFTFTGTANNMVAAIYHLNGTTMVYDACSQFGNGITGSPIIYFNTLTPGTTYYVRVYTTSSSATPTFTICVGALPAPPSNDEAANAITLTPSTGIPCSNAIAGTTIGATPSADAQPPSSTPSYGGAATTDDDVWYKFTATTTSSQLNLTGFINSQNMYVAAYTGTPGSLALFGTSCQGVNSVNGTYILSGLTVGTTYYVRVYSANTTTSLFYVNFNICLGNLPAPPSNDEITGATTLPVNQNGQCATTVSGTTFSATQSLQAPTALGTCNNISSGVYPTNDDVWYQFNTGTGTNFQLTVTNPNANAALNAGLYSGLTAAAATYVTGTCGAANGLIFTGLTPNTTYYIRLYTTSATTQTYTDFNLCLAQLPVTPANDDPAGAITLTLNNDWNCGATYNGSTYSATATAGIAAPTINVAGVNDDVWYKFTPTTTTVLAKFSNVPVGSGFVMNAQVYDASFNTVGNGISTVGFLSGLTPNTVYYLRVYNTSSAASIQYSTFTLCLGNQPAALLANDDCDGAITLIPNNDYALNNVVNGTTANATASVGDDPTGIQGNVSGAWDDDVWYKFTANSTVNRVNLINIFGTGATTGINIALYSGACGALVLDSSFATVTTRDFYGLTPGTTYYLRVYSASAIQPNFSTYGIYIGKPPATPVNDAAADAITIPVTTGFGGSTTLGTLASSTLENMTAPYCSGMLTDVWYKAVVPASGQMVIQMDPVNTSNTDDMLSVYTGTPGNFMIIGCSETGNPNSSNMPRVNITGQTPGSTIYLRAGTASSLATNVGDFGIEAWDPVTLPDVSAGGNCVATSQVTINAATGNTYTWVPLRDASQNIVAELFANGNNLGAVNANVFKNTGAVRVNNGVYLLDRNITITPATQPGSNVTVRLYLTNAELTALQNADPSVTSIASLNATKTTETCNGGVGVGGPLVLQNTNGTYNGANKYVEYSVASFSSFYLRGAGSTPLPIDLLDFKGYNSGSVNNLSWDVATHSNVASFELQRSADGSHFETIATILDNGKTAYSYTDRTPASGLNLYRLMMVDQTQKESYSSIVTINTNEKNNWTMQFFPNPAKQQLQMSITGNVDQNASIQIYDLMGKQLKQISVTANFGTIDLAELPAGTYIVKYMDNSHSYVSKITKE